MIPNPLNQQSTRKAIPSTRRAERRFPWRAGCLILALLSVPGLTTPLLAASSALPDLTKGTDLISATTARAGTGLTLTGTVINQGDAASGATAIYFYLHETTETYDSGSMIGQVPLAALAAHAVLPDAWEFSYQLPSGLPGGTYKLSYWIDAPSLVTESNEGNNKFVWTLTILATAPPTITTSSLPAGSVGKPYNQTLAASGGVTPYSWSIASSSLPPGLALAAASGAITGTPTLATNANFTVKVTGSNGSFATRAFSLTINPPSGLLLVQTTGRGALSPNYSNDVLEFGKSYTMMATAAAGFAFTNWVISTNWAGGVVSNNAKLTFLMESNLTLQANFADVTKPTATIVSPAANLKVDNVMFTVTGKAGDNVGVANVFYSLNASAWATATTGNHWTNWMATVTLLPGVNTIKVYALDTSGLASPTNSVNFYYTPIPLSIISVSNSSPTPLTPLTLTAGGLTSSVPLSVTFSNQAGFSFSTSPIRWDADGTVVVAVPLYVDPSTSAITNGTVSLVLFQGEQASAPVTLNIQNLPPRSAYGTPLGEISHAFLIYETMLTADRLGLLQSAQLLQPAINTSTTRSNLATQLQAAVMARSEVDSVLLTNSAVISWGTLPDGTAVQFDQTELDLMDRILAVYLTQQFAGAAFAKGSETTVVSEIMSLLVHQAGVIQLVEYVQGKTNSTDAALALLESGQYFLNSAQPIHHLPIRRPLSLESGPQPLDAADSPATGVVAMLAGLAHVSQAANNVYAQLIPTAICCADPSCTSQASGEAATIAGLQFASSVAQVVSETALFAWGEDIGSGPEAALGLKSVASLTEYVSSGASQSDDASGAVLAGSPLFTQTYAPGQGLAQVLGTAVDGNYSGITAPQSSLTLCCFGAGALGIQGIADPSGNYDLFVALGVPGTDYSRLTLSAASGGSTWDSETVDLSDLDANKPVHVPPVAPYYTLTVGTAGTGTGRVNVSPQAASYVSGSVVKLTAVPDSGCTFTDWSGDASGSAPSTSVTMNANKSVTATFDNPDAPWNGAWSGSWNYIDSGGCGFSGGGNATLNLSVSKGVVTGSGTIEGIECEDLDTCTFLDRSPGSGPVSGTCSSTTLNIRLDSTFQGGSCSGKAFTISIVGSGNGAAFSGNVTHPNSSTMSGRINLTKAP